MVAGATLDRELVPLTKAGRLFDNNPSVPTLIRWLTVGVLGPDRKTRIILRSVMLGGRRFIPRDAAAEFIAALNATPRVPLTKPGSSAAALQSMGF